MRSRTGASGRWNSNCVSLCPRCACGARVLCIWRRPRRSAPLLARVWRRCSSRPVRPNLPPAPSSTPAIGCSCIRARAPSRPGRARPRISCAAVASTRCSASSGRWPTSGAAWPGMRPSAGLWPRSCTIACSRRSRMSWRACALCSSAPGRRPARALRCSARRPGRGAKRCAAPIAPWGWPWPRTRSTISTSVLCTWRATPAMSS